uniref:Ovule protein n=1 Tax=Heterorhabditis bacteriophora TaxID=37862 RepID=A0A1I7X7Z3_HETBA
MQQELFTLSPTTLEIIMDTYPRLQMSGESLLYCPWRLLQISRRPLIRDVDHESDKKIRHNCDHLLSCSCAYWRSNLFIGLKLMSHLFCSLCSTMLSF